MTVGDRLDHGSVASAVDALVGQTLASSDPKIKGMAPPQRRRTVEEIDSAADRISVEQPGPRGTRSTPETSAPLNATRCCVLCGRPLAGRRSHAQHCSGACRAEAARLRSILAGRGSGPYLSIADRLAAVGWRPGNPLQIRAKR
jgi:hypothetical protein